MWRRGAVGAAAGFVVALGATVATADAAQQKTDAPVRVQSVEAAQKTLLTKGPRVTLAVRRSTRVRVVVTARRKGAKAAPVVSRSFERTLKSGRRVVTLRLSAAGRRTLGTCDARTLTVTVLRVRGRAGRAMRIARASRALQLDRAGRCRAGVGVPAKPGREANEPPIDLSTSNADRCDFIDPAACLFPFPNDRYTVPDTTTATGRRLALTLASMPANIAGKPMDPTDQNRGDGFSPGSLITTKVPGLETAEVAAANKLVPIDDLERAFDRDQRVLVVNARTKERHLIWAEIDANPSDPADRTLILRPGTHFTEGDRYVVALRDLRDAGGKVIEASPGFRVLRDGRRTTNPAVESRRAHFESLFVTLAEAGVDRDSLYRAWDFTVASRRSLSERLLQIRDDAFRQLGDANLADLKVDGRSPAFTVEKVTENPDGADNPIARRIEGTVTVPCYLNLPGCVSGAKFSYAGRTGTLPQPIPGNTTQARFTCHIPRVGLTGPAMRPSLYGHGLLGSRGKIGQGQLRAFGEEHRMLFCSTDWVGMSCADLDLPPDQNTVATNLADTVAGRAPVLPNCDLPNIATLLLDLSNFGSLTDRVQQGIVNFLYLGRALIHPDGFGRHEAFRTEGRSMIDSTRLYYDGNSQGGIIGGALVSVAPDLERGALGVPGMNYSTLLRRSVDFDQYAQILYQAYPDLETRPLLLALMQLLWDRAETAGYAAHLTKDAYPNTPPHEVLLHVGLGDHQVAQVTAEVMARTAGMSARTPWADTGRDRDKGDGHFGIPAIKAFPFSGSAIVLWDIGPKRTVDGKELGTPPPPNVNVPPRDGVDPHEAPRREPAARAMKSAFFAPAGKVVDTCAAGKPCYASGWTGP